MYDWRRKSLLYVVKGFIRTSSIPWLRVLPQHCCSSLAPNYSTASIKRQNFRIQYLVDNCGFSPEIASELSKQVSFIDSRNPDAVLNLLRNLNISDTKIRDTIELEPSLLASNPATNISPKLEFFKSKGASTSQLAIIVTANPRFLRYSLSNNRNTYDLINSFLHSEEKTITSIKRSPRMMTDCYLERKVKFLQDYGVPKSGIAVLLRHWPGMINCKIDDLKRKADEVKELGFHPSKLSFIEALRCKLVVSKPSWQRKVELLARWGWSDEILHKAFIKRPFFMLTSDSKIQEMMTFFVNHIGWDSLRLANTPILLTLSLKKRIIPRTSVLEFLQSKGLIKDVSCTHFLISESMFRRKIVNCFLVEAPQLLKLYEEKLSLAR